MFVKHCKVEVYLLELNLCENDNMDKVVTRHFSKADTIGKTIVYSSSGDFYILGDFISLLGGT